CNWSVLIVSIKEKGRHFRPSLAGSWSPSIPGHRSVCEWISTEGSEPMRRTAATWCWKTGYRTQPVVGGSSSSSSGSLGANEGIP
uniref:Uncharacterized protein n=1 Tax=Mustela putorius furo TaxID=9669 RepID=M3XN00_MUSPF